MKSIKLLLFALLVNATVFGQQSYKSFTNELNYFVQFNHDLRLNIYKELDVYERIDPEDAIKHMECKNKDSKYYCIGKIDLQKSNYGIVYAEERPSGDYEVFFVLITKKQRILTEKLGSAKVNETPGTFRLNNHGEYFDIIPAMDIDEDDILKMTFKGALML